MDPTLDSQYFALLSLAEGFRTNDPPDMSSCMQCLIAILNLLPASSKYVAKTNLQLGKIILNHTADKQHTDYARSYLEKSLQSTRDHQGDAEVEEVKFEAASLLALVYEKQNQTQGSINLLRKCLEHSTGHVAFHCRLLFQLAQTYARLKDYTNAAAVLSSGADYAASASAADPQLRILFLLSKGMMLMVSLDGSQNWHSIMTEVRQELGTACSMIEGTTAGPPLPPMQKEKLKVFFLLLQVCHFLNSGQVKSMKAPLKSLQLSIQTMTQQQEDENDAGTGHTVGERFVWLQKEQMCILVYLVTVLHSMQAGYMDKAQKYTEKALMQIDNLRQSRAQQATGEDGEEDEGSRLLSTFQLILLEHMAMCRLVMGQRGLAIKETVQALQISHRLPGLETRHKPVIQTLLGLYAMSMNQMMEAEKQLSAVLKQQSGISSDLRILCSLNLCIVYLRMNREPELTDLLSQTAPEKLPSQSHSLKAASFYVMGLNAFFKARYPDAKRFLRETLKIANSEDLNRLTSCSLVLLGHIFYSQGSHRESMNMVTPAMQLASKIPDIEIQMWATALLKDLHRDDNNQTKVEEYSASHSLFQQQLYNDQCQAASQPEHEYIHWTDSPSPHLS